MSEVDGRLMGCGGDWLIRERLQHYPAAIVVDFTNSRVAAKRESLTFLRTQNAEHGNRDRWFGQKNDERHLARARANLEHHCN
jgi:hypothetical protein